MNRERTLVELGLSAAAAPAAAVDLVPQLGKAFASITAPVVLMLDDVHLVHNQECRAALSVLADHVPGGSRLVLAGRTEPPLRVARLRAEGRILEIGPADLSLTLTRRRPCCAALSVGEDISTPETVAVALGERSLLAMARGEWNRAETLADEAGAILRRAKFEGVLACAVQARTALHRGDTRAARQHLVNAQRARPTLTYALPHLAVQARIELARAHLGLADITGARTLMREVDEILQRRPALGSLVGEAALSLSQFWADVLGRQVAEDSALEHAVLLADRTDAGWPLVVFNLVPEPKTVKNRLHLDLISNTFDAETERLLSLGAQRLRDAQTGKARWTTFADIEGNEFDLIAG